VRTGLKVGEWESAFCPALGPGSKVPFSKVEDALARSYNGCAYCLPGHDRG
jgi:hypothetical protein